MKFEQVTVPSDAKKDDLVAALAAANATIAQANSQYAELEKTSQDLVKFNLDQSRMIEQFKGQLAKQASASERNMHAGQGTHVRVSSAHPTGGHWRAGRYWSRDAKDVAISDLTPEQIDAMRADARLVVVDL
jgi:type II secretory pathway pseudopilin PulG